MMNYRLNRYRTIGGIFSTIDSAGQAHQNGCDMTRNIPQPIWCIGPQKLYTFPRRPDKSEMRFFSISACYARAATRCISYFSFDSLTTLRSFRFFFFLITLRTDTILFIKAGCDSRELYDKPTLMVKVCPVSRQNAIVLAHFSTNVSRWISAVFIYKDLQARTRPLNILFYRFTPRIISVISLDSSF